MKSPFFLLFFLVLFSYSCKKIEVPNGNIGEHEFFMLVNSHNNWHNIIAGENSLFMFTEQTQNNGGSTLSSFFAPFNCADCEPAIRFVFFVNDTQNFLVESQIQPLNLYNVQAKYTYDILLTPNIHNPSGGNYDILWQIDNVPFSEQSIVLEKSMQAEKVDISLTVTQGGLSSEIQDFLYLDDECLLTANALFNKNTQFHDFSFNFSGNPNEIEWISSYFGTRNVSNFSFQYPAGTLVDPVTLAISSANCSRVKNLNVVVDSLNPQNLIANFSSEIQKRNSSNNGFVGNDVYVEYLLDGRLYSSQLANQQSVHFIIIDKVENYLPNALGIPTKKVFLSFNLLLSDGLNEITLEGSGAIAVAIP